MNASFHKTVLNQFSFSADRIVFSDAKTLRVADISRGLVVVFAVWSAPSHVAWRALNRILADSEALQFFVYIIDADELTAEFVNTLSLVPHGYGESYWIRDGKILHTWSAKDGPVEQTRRFTQEAFR